VRQRHLICSVKNSAEKRLPGVGGEGKREGRGRAFPGVAGTKKKKTIPDPPSSGPVVENRRRLERGTALSRDAFEKGGEKIRDTLSTREGEEGKKKGFTRQDEAWESDVRA